MFAQTRLLHNMTLEIPPYASNALLYVSVHKLFLTFTPETF